MAAANLDVDRQGERKLGARSSRDGLASVVPVKIPLEELVVAGVKLGTLGSSRDLVTGSSSDLDVESLWPELALRDIAVVVDGHHFCAEDVVTRWDLLGDGDGLGVAAVVEDGVCAPVAGRALLAAVGVTALAVVD